MRNRANQLQRLCQSIASTVKTHSLDWSIFFLLTLGLTGGWTLEAKAETAETAPPQLQEAIAQINLAANSRDLEGVMEFYGSNFRNSDGLNRTSLKKALAKLWENYSQLNYQTELKSWHREGNAIVTETVTYITGTRDGEERDTKIESTMRSRQRFENQKIVDQKILSEQTQLTSGDNPPQVQVNIPEQVRIGQRYNFDVIVQEPLGNDLLMGAALEEATRKERYTNPAEWELDLLSAGGIYKIGRAPLREDDRWISAVLIRGDGMTMVTRRLQVIDRSSASNGSSR